MASSEMIAAERLWPGAVVDLEGDEYADPDHENASFEHEYQIVMEVSVIGRTATTVLVEFESDEAIRFPIGHKVKVAAIESYSDPLEVIVAFFQRVREETA